MKPFPRRLTFARRELDQTIVHLHEVSSEAVPPKARPRFRPTDVAEARLHVKRAIEALAYVLNHPDNPWVVSNVSEHIQWARLMASPEDVPKTIAGLRKIQEAEGIVKLSAAARPLLPAHWYLPEVLAFTCGWLDRYGLESYLVVVQGTYQRLDLVEHTIYLTENSSPQNRWWSVFSYMQQLCTLPSITDATSGTIQSLDLTEVLEFFLLRRLWWKPELDIDPKDTVLAIGTAGTEG